MIVTQIVMVMVFPMIASSIATGMGFPPAVTRMKLASISSTVLQ